MDRFSVCRPGYHHRAFYLSGRRSWISFGGSPTIYRHVAHWKHTPCRWPSVLAVRLWSWRKLGRQSCSLPRAHRGRIQEAHTLSHNTAFQQLA